MSIKFDYEGDKVYLAIEKKDWEETLWERIGYAPAVGAAQQEKWERTKLGKERFNDATWLLYRLQIANAYGAMANLGVVGYLLQKSEYNKVAD